MLFLLTGDIQIGKTRWLMRTLPQLEEQGVAVSGVLTPGIWRHRSPVELEQAGEPAAGGEYEKLGIDALLLPERTRIPFAKPVAPGEREMEALRAEGGGPSSSQSRQAGLAWDISEDALAAINAHFDALAASSAGKTQEKPGLLVIDELGRLELLRNGGLTSALALVGGGPTEAFPHMLAIVRESLLGQAHERFGRAWQGRIADITPDDASARMIFDAFAPPEA